MCEMQWCSLANLEMSSSAPPSGRTVVREDSAHGLRSARLGWTLIVSVVDDPGHPLVSVSL
jgi:hypothetical protein